MTCGKRSRIYVGSTGCTPSTEECSAAVSCIISLICCLSSGWNNLCVCVMYVFRLCNTLS